MSEMTTLLAAAIAQAGWAAAPAGDPGDVDAYLDLLRVLYATGRRDLPLGRLLEGHVDAVQIALRHGTPGQAAALRGALAAGATLGVWNAGLAGEPLVLADGRLHGAKSFASGTGVLSHALVTADTPAGPQLLLLDLARMPPAMDRDWWRTTGMQRSETHRVRWADAAVPPEAMIGPPGVYAGEPWFSGGALRFVAVHAGGVAALLDRTRDHLVKTARVDDPFQAARLAELFMLAEQAADSVRTTARSWFDGAADARRPRVAAARLAVTDAAGRAIRVAQEAVGVEGHFRAHPLSATIADLQVYLRQPQPDAQRLRVGAAVAAGTLAAAL